MIARITDPGYELLMASDPAEAAAIMCDAPRTPEEAMRREALLGEDPTALPLYLDLLEELGKDRGPWLEIKEKRDGEDIQDHG